MNKQMTNAEVLVNLAQAMGMNVNDLSTPISDPSVNWTSIDTKIKHQGTEIVLPGDPTNMDYDDAIATIARIRDDENQLFDVHVHVDGAPWDCLVAVYRAMQEIYGVVTTKGMQTWFGEIKPDYITVKTGHRDEDVIQVPNGIVHLPGVTEPVKVSMRSGGVCIDGTVRKRDRAILEKIAITARRILRTDSVYKGKAVRFGVDDAGRLQINVQPEFIDLTGVQESDMIHTPETEALIRTAIFSMLKNTAGARKHKIPRKRGILLEGRYGTGKSLTARVTAKIANDNEWTFILLDRPQGLKAAIDFAKNYQPCVIFAEDIDRAADRSSEAVNDLVNTLDGVITKDMEMMVVLTTNHIDKIDQSLLRPGRFDAVISLQAPDGPTAERIIRMYARDLLDANVDFSKVHPLIAGSIPAMLREVVERAKLAMLVEDRTYLTTDDLYVSALGMKRHMELLAPPPAAKSPAAKFGEAFSELIAGSILGVDLDDVATQDGINNVLDALHDKAEELANDIRSVDYAATAAAGASDKTLTLAKEIIEHVK
jgi:hypothetical protein